MDKKYLKYSVFIIFLFLVLIVYLLLGFFLKESIFFSYDMPRDALIVQDFLRNGTYLTSQNYYAIGSWLNVSWGPAYIFYYAFLLKISPDPLMVSYLLTLINVIGLVSIITLGWMYFSPLIGLLAGTLLAFNPYWFTYIRLIYQPSPITLFLPIAMLLYFGAAKRKPIALILLPVIWTIMFQIYIPTFSFILTSIVFLLFYLKRSSYKYLLLGGLISMIFIFPSIKFYKENPVYIQRFFDAPKQFTPKETTIEKRGQDVFLSFIQIPVGGMFRWQTGASYNDFVGEYTSDYPLVSQVLTIILITSLIWNLYFSIRHKDPKRGVIVAWALCPLWYLNVLWTSDLVPRYFLISFPSIMLLISMLFYDVANKIRRIGKLRFIATFVPILIASYWIVFNIQYNDFIKNYSFPHGWFYDITETPYVYIRSAIDWVIFDAHSNNCTPILSDDIKNPDFALWMEVEYPWKYIYKKNTEVDDSANNCYYLITHNDLPKSLGVKYELFGPFAAFRNY